MSGLTSCLLLRLGQMFKIPSMVWLPPPRHSAWSPTQLMSEPEAWQATPKCGSSASVPPDSRYPQVFTCKGRGPCSRRSATAHCGVPRQEGWGHGGAHPECPSHQSPPPNRGHTLILVISPNIKASSPRPGNLLSSLESEEERELENEKSWKERDGQRNRDSRLG